MSPPRVPGARRALEKIPATKRAANAAHYRALDLQIDRLEYPLTSPAAVGRVWAYVSAL